MEFYGFFYNGLKPSHYHWYQSFININRFFLSTGFKLILVMFYDLLIMHSMLYKALFANLTLVVFKELIIKYKPYENASLN